MKVHRTYDSIASPALDSDTNPPRSVVDGAERHSVGNKKSLFFKGTLMWLVACCVAAFAVSSLTSKPKSPDSVSILPELEVEASPRTSESSSSSFLSARGRAVKSVRDDMAMFSDAVADPYHPTDNKDGYLTMLVAENKLMWQEMANKLKEVQASSELPEWIFGYGNMGGEEKFKASLANMMKRWIPSPVNPDKLRLQAGTGSILDVLSWLLTDPFDGVLVTGPNYSAFGGDFGTHGQAKLHVCPTQAKNNYEPTMQELDDCYDKSVTAGNPPKILVICQPNNPTGIVYSPESMHLMVTWTLSKKGMHVVSDEIYALSTFPGAQMTSAAEIMSGLNDPDKVENYLGERVHIAAGLSKDWGISGFRVGSLLSHNEQVLKAIDLIGYYEAVSQYTQHALTAVFNDDEWVDWYIHENQRRLYATFLALQEALSLIGVSVANNTQGALFAWADFSAFVITTEEDLWHELFEDAKVAFTTGKSCNGDKEGMFRIVYPWPEGGVEAMQELGRRLVLWKAAREAKY